MRDIYDRRSDHVMGNMQSREGVFWDLSHFGAIISALLEIGVGLYSLGRETGFFLNCFPLPRSPRRSGVWIPREFKWKKA